MSTTLRLLCRGQASPRGWRSPPQLTSRLRRVVEAPRRALQTAGTAAGAAGAGDDARIALYSMGQRAFTRAGSLQALTSGRPLDQLLADQSSPAWWLSIRQPTETETKALGAALSVHPLTTEDILAGETREKLDIFDNYSFISYRAFDPDPNSATYLVAANMYLLVFARGIVSLHASHARGPLGVERRLERIKEAVSPQWFAYALIDDVTDAFVPALGPIQTRIETLDSDAHSLSSAEAAAFEVPLLRDMGGARRDVVRARRLLGQKADVVKALAKRHGARSAQAQDSAHASEVALHLSDIEDHLVTAAQDIAHMEETLAHVESNCLAAMNTQMARASQESNEAISKLTVLSTVLLPLNVITGLWGMNVLVPGQDAGGLHWFGGLAALMAVVASSGYWWATRFMRRRRRP